ncbi:MAG: hypothetical protein KatS3mg059_1255 [Thermomicrobiales bacterium]|nr:MAG: hypothetical protein KatS3mg059_1255 [Thermomicrobiales bacterium]
MPEPRYRFPGLSRWRARRCATSVSPVAAVIAESRPVAEDAAGLVTVHYDPLPAVVDPFEARQDGAPQLYDEVKNNISVRYQTVHGDVDAALASAPVRVKAKIRAPRCAPMPMEPRGTVAAPGSDHARADDLGVKSGAAQLPQRDCGGLWPASEPSTSDCPRSWRWVWLQIRRLPRRLRGCGGCTDAQPPRQVDRDPERALPGHQPRPEPGGAISRSGRIRTGKIQALRARITLDSGAYPKALGLAWCTWVMSTGPYVIPNLDYLVEGVYTNTVCNGAYRGAGRPEATFYLERLMDLIADEAGLDPVQVRRVNFIPPDQFPYTTLSGEHYDSGEYEKPLNKALELVGYEDLRRQQAELRKQGRYLGIGVASYVEICGFGPWESSTVRVEPGGEVTIFTGISPHGQGQETTFAQLAADYIGADFDSVIVHHGDTGNTSHGNGTGGSRGLAVGGAAVVLSLTKIREKARRIAAQMLEAAEEDIELAEGKYRVKGVPTRGVTLAEIAKMAYSGDLPPEIDAGLESTDFFRPADETFPFGTHVAVVEVFPDTGEVKLLRYVSVDDCGNIISPLLVTGQVHGGVAQGIGLALWEELHYDANGEAPDRDAQRLRRAESHGFPDLRNASHDNTNADQPTWCKGHRRGSDDWRDANGGQCRD